MNTDKIDVLEKELEDTIGNLYSIFYRMRQEQLYQEEYDNMGTLLHMLEQDRQVLRSKYKVKY